MRAGFASVDITPRVGVGLCGFGPYLNRFSVGVRDRLKARAAAFADAESTAVLVSCDLIGVTAAIAAKVKALVAAAEPRVPAAHVLVHCTHTHSGPNTGGYIGWGDEDAPYLELLPGRIAKACLGAVANLREVKVCHAVAPCEGIGHNREYDKDGGVAVADAMRPDWRPARPEKTDTTCQVLKFLDIASGGLAGFMAYFGCHPVVCCQETRFIHGDYCGMAMSSLEQEFPGATGLFLQGAQGDVNTCVVHKPENEAMAALEVIAARFAAAVRHGLQAAAPLAVDRIACRDLAWKFSSKEVPLARLREILTEKQAIVNAPGAGDQEHKVRMAVVVMHGVASIIRRLEAGEDLLFQEAEIQGVRLGPVAFLSAPFEIMQEIKNEVVARALAPIPLVMGISNGCMGYAPDRTVAARGGYAVDIVPMICGRLPYRDVHAELVEALLELDRGLGF